MKIKTINTYLVRPRWGGVEILVDPFTLGDTGEIKLQLFSYADVKVALAKSFSKLVIA